MKGYAAHYLAVRELLAAWSDLWGYSVFHRLAEMERRVPEAWFHYGEARELAAQFGLGQGEPDPSAPESLREWIQTMRGLCALPRVGRGRGLSPALAQGLTPKKQHEIEAVLEFFRAEGIPPARILDIGGGAGHLARHLARELGCPVASVDRDPVLQEKGQGILRRSPGCGGWKPSVEFVWAEFPGARPWRPQGRGEWALGLHTCGRLAWSQLELVRSGFAVLNVGCCYEKMAAGVDTERSCLARKHPLPWTEEALFLANRGGVERTQEEFIFQQRVQRFRFSLHELLIEEGCRGAGFEAVGSASAGAYGGTFAAYARDRLQGFGAAVPPSLRILSDRAYEEFYRSRAARVERQRFIAFLRNLLARPLEIALLLDRALYLAESGKTVRMMELFDPKLSPRNIGLVALSPEDSA